MTMNKILILLFLFPIVCLSQSEVDEKVRKRSERNNPPVTIVEPSPVIVPTPTVVNPYYYNRYTPYTPYVPYRNRSGYYGNEYYSDNNYYNRQPLELNTKIGLLGGLSSPNSIGLYTTIGGQNSFVYLSYEGSKTSEYEHYNNISFEEVFSWEDELVDEFERYSSFTVAIGSDLFEGINHFAGVNFNRIDKDLVFYDEYHILSENGEYSINDSDKRDFGLVYGLLFDIRSMNVGTSIYFLTDPRVNLHFGFNF